MKISIQNKREFKITNGFTIVELVVVISGLAILSAVSIPNVLENIKLSKIEEAKAIMNSYISDCLGQYRLSTDPSDFYTNSRPENLDEVKLGTLGYRVESAKNKCSWVSLVPSDEKDKLLYSFDFRTSIEGKVLKTGKPTAQRTLNSCRGWAGKNCSLSAEKAAEFAAAAALATKKNNCLAAYSLWKVNNGDGNTVTWNSSTNQCDKAVWLFNGTPVNDQAAYDALVKQKYGTVCQEWRNDLKAANYISKIDSNGLGIGETKDPECNKANYWFHSGQDFSTQVEWNKFNLEYQAQECNQSKIKAINANHKGEFTYGPYQIPSPPCGRSVYLCNGTEYSTISEYQATSCYSSPKKDPPVKPPSRCDGVSYPRELCKRSGWKNTNVCRCAPGGVWNR